MKTKQLFWGILFLSLGILYLLVEVMNVHINLGGFYHYWPVSLIFIGLAVLSKENSLKLIFSALAGVVFAVVIFSFFSKSWIPWGEWHDWDDECSTVQTVEKFNEPFDASIKNVSANFKLGAGRIEVTGGNDNLATVKSANMKEMFVVNTNKNGEDYDFEVVMKHAKIEINDSTRRKLEVKLNDKPNYSFNFELGAADVDLDLSTLKVEKVDLQTGAASCRLKVKEFATETMRIKIEAGAASVKLIVPKEVGAQIRSKTALATTHFNGFKEVSNDVYETDNFGKAKKSVYIDIEGGVATFDVSLE